MLTSHRRSRYAQPTTVAEIDCCALKPTIPLIVKDGDAGGTGMDARAMYARAVADTINHEQYRDLNVEGDQFPLFMQLCASRLRSNPRGYPSIGSIKEFSIQVLRLLKVKELV